MIVLLSTGLIAGWWLSHFLWRRRNNPDRLPLPPGPKGYPIIGNLLGMPTDKPWQEFDRWSKIYGEFCIDHKPASHISSWGIYRRYDIFQDTWTTISCSRKRWKDLWSIRETVTKVFWPRTFSHVDWIVSSLFSMLCPACLLENRMDFKWNMATLRYGPQWRSYRRTFHDYFHPNIVHKYHSVQVAMTRVFLRRLLKSPDRFIFHIRQ